MNMQKTPASTTDVLIVGAGPTGLTAATLLARYGVNFRIVDKNERPAQKSKALGVQARTLELWDKLGMAEGAVERGQALRALNLITKGTLEKGGKPFMALGRDGKEVSPYPYLLIHEQNKTEKMLLDDLEQHAGPNGAYGVERSTSVVSLGQTSEGVAVTLRFDDGARELVRARYLIAADGASSFVRKTLGLEFGGATYADPLFVADVDMTWSLDRDKFYAQVPRQGMLTFFPMRGDGYSESQYRIIGRIPKAWEDREITDDDIQNLLDEHSVVKANINHTRWVSKYRIHRRMTQEFRAGRIFLAGDAAHIHSPAGGQGMNTGIQDAWNVAWKLALVVKGQADEALLTSYESERIPVAKMVLNGSDKGFSFIGSPNLFLHLLRSTLLPRLTSLASRESLGKGVFKLLSQTWINYRKSPVVDGDSGARRARPGDRAPYAHFDGGDHAGESIFSLLKGVEHHLLFFEGKRSDADFESRVREVETVSSRVRIDPKPVKVYADNVALHEAYDVKAPTVFLIRPDGHIGYRGALSEPAALMRYLRQVYTFKASSTSATVHARRTVPA